MALIDLMTTSSGLKLDKMLVRYSGHSLLNHLFARQVGISPNPALMLRSTGRISGQIREAVLPYFPAEDEWLIVGSRGGMPKDPGWIENLRANPIAEIVLQRRSLAVSARELIAEEYRQQWQAISEALPTYRDYQARCAGQRQIPIMALKRLEV